MTELRCDNSILFGVIGQDYIEVKCRSSRCGAGNGVVVLHRFALPHGNLIDTKRFKNPPTQRNSQ